MRDEEEGMSNNSSTKTQHDRFVIAILAFCCLCSAAPTRLYHISLATVSAKNNVAKWYSSRSHFLKHIFT